MDLLVTLLIAGLIALVGKFLIDALTDDYNSRNVGYVILVVAVVLYILGFWR